MPVDFNEPMSALQKRCEELQYTALLREAAETDDEALRMAKVAAFIASGFATAKYRIQRKPFNPLLGETFECFRPDRGIVYFAEKAQHHPAVLLCSAHDPDHRWLYTGSIGAQEKFLGRSFEILPKETNRLKFPARDITVSWTKPSAYVRGLLAGERYIEVGSAIFWKRSRKLTLVCSMLALSKSRAVLVGPSNSNSRKDRHGVARRAATKSLAKLRIRMVSTLPVCKVVGMKTVSAACGWLGEGPLTRASFIVTMNRDNDRETIVVWQIEEPTGGKPSASCQEPG